MDNVTILGLVAAVLTTVAFMPQAFKAWKTKSTRDISLGTFTVLAIGLILWLVHGLMVNSLPLIVANAITAPLALSIVALKLKYG